MNRRILFAALEGDAEPWHEAWASAARLGDADARDRLLDALPPPVVRRRLARWFERRLALAADPDLGMRERGRIARELIGVLIAVQCHPYVSRSRQWGVERVVHLGVCGAPSHMKLSASSAAWDLARGQICGNCKRALIAA